MVKWLFLSVPWGCMRFVIVVFPDHTHLLFSLTLTVRGYLISIAYLLFSFVQKIGPKLNFHMRLLKTERGDLNFINWQSMYKTNCMPFIEHISVKYLVAFVLN